MGCQFLSHVCLVDVYLHDDRRERHTVEYDMVTVGHFPPAFLSLNELYPKQWFAAEQVERTHQPVVNICLHLSLAHLTSDDGYLHLGIAPLAGVAIVVNHETCTELRAGIHQLLPGINQPLYIDGRRDETGIRQIILCRLWGLYALQENTQLRL